ncbi:MAG: glycosyltransferase family 2 protein [Acidimicrobiales bacterium]
MDQVAVRWSAGVGAVAGGAGRRRRAEAAQPVTAAAAQEAADAFLAAHPPGDGAPLAVVIPAYDEEGTIGQVVASVPAEVAGLATETIVVVDGARDATAARALEAGALVCDVAVNRGQGAAFRLGYQLARSRGAQVVATLDADGQFDPSELPRVVGPVVAGEADLVNGSRRLGTDLTTDPVRRTGVVVFGALVSVLIRQRITDPACGLRAMRAEVTARVTLDQPQYQSSELLISSALAGFRVVEVPITMSRRRSGTTKKGGNLRYGARFARVILATWQRDWGTSALAPPPPAKITVS